MRGKGNGAPKRHKLGRITPAHAGKRIFRLFDCCGHGDHPRACGEKLASTLTTKLYRGSPPRMRGKGSRHMRLLQRHRITPAHAGKSCLQRRKRPRTKDHPRACGEKRSKFIRKQDVKGSPPRMRGKATFDIDAANRLRITPAHAGKSSLRLHIRSIPWDHPRACGEKFMSAIARW